MTSPADAITTRFNPRPRVAAHRAAWKLRTEKLIAGAWQTMATFPAVDGPEQASQQRKRLERHAEAFGGLVRLMRGELLLAAWQDGKLVCDLRSEVEAA